MNICSFYYSMNLFLLYTKQKTLEAYTLECITKLKLIPIVENFKIFDTVTQLSVFWSFMSNYVTFCTSLCLVVYCLIKQKNLKVQKYIWNGVIILFSLSYHKYFLNAAFQGIRKLKIVLEIWILNILKLDTSYFRKHLHQCLSSPRTMFYLYIHIYVFILLYLNILYSE